jgi:citrate synthase
MKKYLTAKEVTAILGVSTATLYAYVSRGLIRSEAIDGSSRTRRYNADDVQKLKARKTQRKNPAEAARLALHWGAPVLESALTLIADGNLYYRGYEALELAVTRTFEQVAALFWLGDLNDAERLFLVTSPLEHYLDAFRSLDAELPLVQKLHIALVLANTDDLLAYDLSREQVARTGTRILHMMTGILVGNAASSLSIAHQLSVGWHEADLMASHLLDAALILYADHELNASSFAARVAASTEATPYSVVIAGLATLQGRKHGGNTALVEALFDEIAEPGRVHTVIANRLRSGERIPGFGHKLYPDGDPRAKCLLKLLNQNYPNSPAVALANAVIDKVAEVIDYAPNIDFASVTLTRALNLPDGTALALFALGRTVGWIGHAIEQYAQAELIRPRATYVGVPPRKI